jgi:hypothetical protein
VASTKKTAKKSTGKKFRLVAQTETFALTTHVVKDPDDKTRSPRTLSAKAFDNRKQMADEIKQKLGNSAKITQVASRDGKKVTTVGVLFDVNVKATGESSITRNSITTVTEKE